MEAIGMIKPTSKASLKQTCLFLSNLDVDKAAKMYDFLVKDMQGIPDVEPETRPFIQSFGEQASTIVGWFRDNRDMIGDGIAFIQNIVSKKPSVSAAPLPPING